MADFDNLGDDNMVDYIRGRCNTWPRSQLKPADSEDQLTTYSHFSPLTPPEYSSELSLINESNESIHNSLHNSADFVQWSPNNCSSIKLTSTPSVTNYKAGHPSYVELITQAILSSPEKRMTLSEIYDWMVTNVDAFKDQRQLPCSTGWKNSVRHNLSLHSRFKRVKRNGMDKPSWWTVDLTEEVKRDRRHRNLKAGARIRTTASRDTVVDTFPHLSNETQQQNNRSVGTFNSIFSTTPCTNLMSDTSFNNQLINNHLTASDFATLPATTTDPFAQQMLTLNSAAADAVGQLSGYNIGNDGNVTFMRMDCGGGKQPQHQFARTPNNFFDIQQHKSATTNSLWHHTGKIGWTGRESDSTDTILLSQKLSNQHITVDTLAAASYGNSRHCLDGGHYTTNGCHRSLSSCSFSPSGETTNIHQQTMDATANNSSMLPTTTNLCGFAEAITVNLRDANSFADCQIAGRPTITLNVSADCVGDGSSSQGRNHFQTRPANFDEPRQVMRVQLANGTSQDVTIPTPVQLKVVIRSEKCCQTDDLETDLRYRLRVNSTSSVNNYNSSRSAEVNNYNPSSSAESLSTSDMSERCSVVTQPFVDYRETCIVNGACMSSDPWFNEPKPCSVQLGDVIDTYHNDYHHQFVL